MRALVTGVAGFAGNYLAKLLLERGMEVCGFSREEIFEPFLDLDPVAVRYHSVDVRDATRVQSLLSEVRPELVFHLAASSSPSQSVNEPAETFDVNFGGTLTLLESLRLLKVPCRILLVSSSHVYGTRRDAAKATECAALAPETPYAASKAAAEMAAHPYWRCYGLDVVRVRAFNHTGPGQGAGFLCPDLARKVVEIERGLHPPRLEVSNSALWLDFSDVRDIVKGYHRALVNGVAGKVYNLCSGRGVTIQRIAELLSSEASEKVEVGSASSENRPAEWHGLIGDPSSAFRELDWCPTVPLERTLRELLDDCRQRKPSGLLGGAADRNRFQPSQRSS